MNIGMPELIILLGPIVLGLTIWALVDAARRPRHQWDAAGQSQTMWVVLLCVSLVLFGVGLIVALVYLISVRTQRRSA